MLADANGANLHPGMLDDDQDFVDVVAVLLFQKLVHSLTRCFQNTAPIFMQKLAMPSTLRDLAGQARLCVRRRPRAAHGRQPRHRRRLWRYRRGAQLPGA